MEIGDIDKSDFKKWSTGLAIVVNSDMEELVQAEAKDCVTTGIEKASTAAGLNVEKACKYVKDQMDRQYGPNWH